VTRTSTHHYSWPSWTHTTEHLTQRFCKWSIDCSSSFLNILSFDAQCVDYTLSFDTCYKKVTERRVKELIPVLGSQPAGDVSHKPGGRLPLLSARPAVTPTTLKRAATNFAAW